jgi:hypothetical protein
VALDPETGRCVFAYNQEWLRTDVMLAPLAMLLGTKP